MTDESWFRRLDMAVYGRRVVPPDPPGRVPAAPANEPLGEDPTVDPDESASWSTFITYVDSKGDESARTITIRRITGHFGQPETLHAFCHLRKNHRRFTVTNITGMVCTATGEELDPLENCLALHRTGALKIEDLVLTRLMRILTFIARCDGDFHALEQRALEDVLGRYFRFFGGDDAAHACAISEVPRLAPSGEDFMKDLRWLKTAPQRTALARFALDSTAAVVDADNRHHPAEVSWALEVSEALKHIAGRA